MTQPPAQPPAAPGQQPYPQYGPPQPYPPQQYGPPVSPPYAPPYGQPGWVPPPPKKSWASTTKGALTIAGVSVGGVLLLFGMVAAVQLGDRRAAAKWDVEPTSCTFGGSASLPSATVGLTVTNNGGSTRSVRVEIEYRDSSGARLDTDSTYVRNVAPGDTVRTEETTLLDAAPAGSGTCVIVGVR